MRKLRLDLDTLRVDSFETAASGGRARGTVAAHRAESGVSCIAYSCGVGYCEPGTSIQPATDPEPGGTLIC